MNQNVLLQLLRGLAHMPIQIQIFVAVLVVAVLLIIVMILKMVGKERLPWVLAGAVISLGYRTVFHSLGQDYTISLIGTLLLSFIIVELIKSSVLRHSSCRSCVYIERSLGTTEGLAKSVREMTQWLKVWVESSKLIGK